MYVIVEKGCNTQAYKIPDNEIEKYAIKELAKARSQTLREQERVSIFRTWKEVQAKYPNERQAKFAKTELELFIYLLDGNMYSPQWENSNEKINWIDNVKKSINALHRAKSEGMYKLDGYVIQYTSEWFNFGNQVCHDPKECENALANIIPNKFPNAYYDGNKMMYI